MIPWTSPTVGRCSLRARNLSPKTIESHLGEPGPARGVPARAKDSRPIRPT